MNRSGRRSPRSLPSLASVRTILVAHDEPDLPPARVRMKRAGTAGHRGLESLVEAFGTKNSPGCASASAAWSATSRSDFSPGPFRGRGKGCAGRGARRSARRIEVWVRDGIDAAMAVGTPPVAEDRPHRGVGSGGRGALEERPRVVTECSLGGRMRSYEALIAYHPEVGEAAIKDRSSG